MTFEEKCKRRRADGPTPCLCCEGVCIGDDIRYFNKMLSACYIQRLRGVAHGHDDWDNQGMGESF